MPELPEVEIVARSLNKIVSGREIEIASLLRPRLAPETSPKRFASLLGNARVNFVHRRGKHILFDLDNRRTLITHLRMSGKFMLLPDEETDPKFTHAVLYFRDGYRLVFQDQRHFGLMKIVTTDRLQDAKEICKLAPEPLSDDFSFEYLRAALRSSRRTIKEVLLDQTKICGLGNIYASEAMFLAGVSPRRRAFRIKRTGAEALFKSIRKVLSEAVEFGSTLPISPRDIGGTIYGNGSDWEWLVYDREDEPCSRCAAPVRRIVQGGRSTYFCGRCQRG